MDRAQQSAELDVADTESQSTRFTCGGSHENLVYDCLVHTSDELSQRIFDTARCINNLAVLCKFTLSRAERVRICIQIDGGHVEHFIKLHCAIFFQ